MDVDSTIPNLALMKIATRAKQEGWDVDIRKLKIPFYPHRKGKKRLVDAAGYDMVCVSVIFKNNASMYEVQNCDNIIIGGSGHSLEIKLDEDLESCDPDYTIYPEYDFGVGFITRGCVRDCSFCIVRQKEGYVHRVQEVSYFKKFNRPMMFLDNNILGFSEHMSILKEIIANNIKCDLNQGLDIRLLTEDNARLLRQIKYTTDHYIFAFDNINLKQSVEKGNLILKDTGFKDWSCMFYIYVHPDMPIADTVERALWCKENKHLPYIMRDEACYSHENKNFYTDISAWCNQPRFFKKMRFEDFIVKRLKNKDRINNSLRLWGSK